MSDNVLGLTSYDKLFEIDESQTDNEQERVVNISIFEISDFDGHTFEVVDDDEMKDLYSKIEARGVRQPAIVRPKPDGGYEMVCGHRRKFVCEQLGINTMPCIVRNLSDEDATIDMVESNLSYRQNIKPSVKAKSYKAWYEATLKKAGRPNKDDKSPKGRTDAILAKEASETRTDFHRYMDLCNLIPELLNVVDNGKMSVRIASELYKLTDEQQQYLFITMQSEERTPSTAQALKMKQFQNEGKLNNDVIFSIMLEDKPNQRAMFKMPEERIRKYFPSGTPAEKIQADIEKGLELLQRQREKERRRDDAR